MGVRGRIARAGREEGFTLIELLAVMAIIGILTAIGTSAYLGFRDRAATTSAKANVRAALPSIEAYYSDNGAYTGMTTAGLQASYDSGISGTLTVPTVTASTYCVEDTVAGTSAHANGPGGSVLTGGC